MGKTYRGDIQILILWQDNRNRGRRDWYFPKVWEPSEDWTYQCVDMMAEVKNPNVTWIAKHLKDGSYLEVQDIILRSGRYKSEEVN